MNQANPNFQGAQGNFVPRQQQYNQGNYRGGNNFGYQGQFQQSGGQSGSSGQTSSSGNEFMDMLREMQQDMQKRNQLDEVRTQNGEVRDKSIQTLTTQMGQLAMEVAELKKGKGQLPSDTKVNPSHNSSRNIPINHVSVLRSGKEFKANLSSGLVDGVVEDTTGNECDEDEISPSIVSKDSNVEKVIQKPGLGEIFKDKNEEGGPSQIPFPSALTDPGVVSLGAGVSILLGGLYDQYDFGPLARVETTVVLADLSHKLPRGTVQDVIVKVDEFYYPDDFLVLDYSSVHPKQQQNVTFGRPFFSTAHAVIDCRFGTVNMTFGNRKMRLNVYTNNSNSIGVDECFMADLVDGCDLYEYEEDSVDTCFCDFSKQVHACALRVKEKEQDAMALKEGRPPWTHQFESLPVEINSSTKPSLEEPPTLELKDLPSHMKMTYKTPIGTTPYRLVYGKGCHLPMKLAYRAHWAIKTVNADYDEAGKIRKLQLSKIEEVRDEAYECASAYKDKLKKVHDAKIRKRTFEVSQKVWLYNSRSKLFAGKLKSKWMGPYMITRVGQFGDVDIEDVHTNVKQTVNGRQLKPYLEGNDINNLELDKVGYILRPVNGEQA
ncbi:uncharacterized protein LOC110893213 [Helianthus annuus]|uniref:uncharacterized protein LOC110893213 n=1 Tax=Helianthus annuus TaxID=4232 RepID=UPI001652E7C3|nr:uncharacterized protein LOC110893213 [Helianthus annuus]